MRVLMFFSTLISWAIWTSGLQWLLNRFLPALLVVIAMLGLWMLGQHSETGVYDMFQRWSAKSASQSPVVLVLIDDESLDALQSRFGPPPWPRRTFIELVQRIQQSQPDLMVLDSHFLPLQNTDDHQTFSALKGFSNLITGLVSTSPGADTPPDLSRRSHNTNKAPKSETPESAGKKVLSSSYYGLNLGVVSIQEDSDGRIRSLQPVYQTRTLGGIHSGVFPALSLATAHEYRRQQQPDKNWSLDLRLRETPPVLVAYPEKHPKQRIAIPLNAQNSFYLRWYRALPNPDQPDSPVRSHPALSLKAFFDPHTPPPNLAGKIALIGASASYYRDYHQTPMAHRHLGPDIQATAIDNLIYGEFIQKASPAFNLCLMLGASLLIFLICVQIRQLEKTLLYTLGFMIIYFWLAFQVFAQQAFWVDTVTPELFMSVAFLAGNAYRTQFKEKQLAAMEKTLAQLVDPEVFREIRRRAHVLKPGGQKLEITSMFVDIRQFTTLAERLQPVEVTALLNTFYEAVVQVVFDHQGTVDKFMGDGILIMFGAPLPQENHGARALEAAHDLLRITGELSEQWRMEHHMPLDIGISVHSGNAFVGFLGPTDKLEYTAVGDTVNLCVRLQELTKQFHTRLIISNATLAGHHAATPAAESQSAEYLPLGDVPIRGREASITIFTHESALLPQAATPKSEDG